jgi:3-methyladenine DNA glycosylase AlkD
MTVKETVARLKSLAKPENVEGMKRFAVGGKHTLGVSIPDLRRLAKELGRDHKLAAALWKTGIHEARILASMVDDPSLVTEAQLERWVADFDSWDVTDQVCMNLFEKTPHAWQKALEWTTREPEFEKRAGFALMACFGWHDKVSPVSRFEPFFPAIERASDDNRNFVKKAVSWALRNMGKRDKALHKLCAACAKRIARRDSKAARWISSDVLRELTSEKVASRLK